MKRPPTDWPIEVAKAIGLHATLPSGQPIVFDAPGHTKVLAADLRNGAESVPRFGAGWGLTLLPHLVLTGLHVWCREAEDGDRRQPTSAVSLAAAHDLHEALLGFDMHPAMKKMLNFKGAVEDRWEAHVLSELGLAPGMGQHIKRRVKVSDRRSACIEAAFVELPHLAYFLRSKGGAPCAWEAALGRAVLGCTDTDKLWGTLTRLINISGTIKGSTMKGSERSGLHQVLRVLVGAEEIGAALAKRDAERSVATVVEALDAIEAPGLSHAEWVRRVDVALARVNHHLAEGFYRELRDEPLIAELLAATAGAVVERRAGVYLQLRRGA